MKPKHLLAACCLIPPFVTQAAALQCKKFEPESKEVEAERNQKGSGNGFNNELLAAKHVCQYQGTIKDAYAAFRADKKKTGWVIQKQASRATCHPFLVKKPSDTKKAGKKLLKHGYLKKSATIF